MNITLDIEIMNITHAPIYAKNVPPMEQFRHDFARGFFYLLIPLEFIYFANYLHLKGVARVPNFLGFLSLVTLWASSTIVPVSCGPLRSLQKLGIAIGTMKLLDLFARRNSLPKFAYGGPYPDYKLALLYISELRYESFTPNQIRVPHHLENFNEPMQLGIHVIIFSVLQSLPQKYSTVIALEVQFSIYIIWTIMQLTLRYKSSPALFGPLYRADSLTGFWSETWHNAFSAPCQSLAYTPLRKNLPKLGIALGLARSAGALGAFLLMAIFHVYALSPILPYEALKRVGLFFVLNGFGTVVEAMIWQHKKHWLRATMAWIFELSVSSWAVAGVDIPQGLGRIQWGEMCNA